MNVTNEHSVPESKNYNRTLIICRLSKLFNFSVPKLLHILNKDDTLECSYDVEVD